MKLHLALYNFMFVLSVIPYPNIWQGFLWLFQVSNCINLSQTWFFPIPKILKVIRCTFDLNNSAQPFLLWNCFQHNCIPMSMKHSKFLKANFLMKKKQQQQQSQNLLELSPWRYLLMIGFIHQLKDPKILHNMIVLAFLGRIQGGCGEICMYG